MSTQPSGPAAQAPCLRIENVTKRFGDFVAVNDVSLDVQRGEIFCLLGGSGSGKTTLLRMLAGFETPTSGKIYIDGQDMSECPPYDRPVNMMFQSYALFPHMTVEKNVSFGLEQEHLGRQEIKRRVGEILDIVKMTAFIARKPHQLSGGQRQRVALARALVKRPKLLLLDEPLAALDRKLREHTQFELINIQERLGVTFVVVTHDQEEAMTLSSRMGVMNHGKIVQVGTPTDIYEFPATRFVADFIGSVNIFEGKLVEDEPDFVRIRSEELGGIIYVHPTPKQGGFGDKDYNWMDSANKMTIRTSDPEPFGPSDEAIAIKIGPVTQDTANPKIHHMIFMTEGPTMITRKRDGKQVGFAAGKRKGRVGGVR